MSDTAGFCERHAMLARKSRLLDPDGGQKAEGEELTYPIAARTFYVLVLPVFYGSFFLLHHFGLFKFFPLVLFGIVGCGAWLFRAVLRCPVCNESVSRSKSGYYAAWIGPR
jgi:hypothetical protein